MTEINELIKRFIAFLRDDIWKLSLQETGRLRTYLIRLLRVLTITAQNFLNDKCPLHASALTYYTLLSIVPVFAMIFGIAGGFGLDQTLRKLLMERFVGQKEFVQQVLTYADSLLKNTKGGIIAGVGIIVLIWTVVKVLGNIEESFSQIWNITKKRTWVRRFTDYLAIVLLGPLFFLIAGSITVFITTQLKELTASNMVFNVISPVIPIMLKITPYALTWLLFLLVYIIIPNTKVRFNAAFWAALFAGTAYQLVQWIYIEFQIGVAKYNAIYGSFAAIPLLLVWMQLSWFIVLIGAELTYTIQNLQTLVRNYLVRNISYKDVRLLTLYVTTVITKRFAKAEAALSREELIEMTELPPRIMENILNNLTRCGVLARMISENEEEAFQPAMNIDKITYGKVVHELETISEIDFKFKDKTIAGKINTLISDAHRMILKTPFDAPLHKL